MGNYITKIKNIFESYCKTENTQGKKRKHASCLTNLTNNFSQDIDSNEEFSNETDEEEADENQNLNETEETTNSNVSLNQLNSIMNRINQMENTAVGSSHRNLIEPRSINNADFDNLLFARNRLSHLK